MHDPERHREKGSSSSLSLSLVCIKYEVRVLGAWWTHQPTNSHHMPMKIVVIVVVVC